jgi:hypothetical protein
MVTIKTCTILRVLILITATYLETAMTVYKPQHISLLGTDRVTSLLTLLRHSLDHQSSCARAEFSTCLQPYINSSSPTETSLVGGSRSCVCQFYYFEYTKLNVTIVTTQQRTVGMIRLDIYAVGTVWHVDCRLPLPEINPLSVILTDNVHIYVPLDRQISLRVFVYQTS